jgi:uncharacterized coiled-coil DUF342 family protein
MSEMKIVYDCEKKTTSYVPLSAAEIAQRDQDAAAYAEQQAARAAAAEALAELKASAKAKLLAGEPLTEEEANTLVQ